MNAPATAREEARQILDLLPHLRQWVTARVQEAGLEHDLSLRQYAALRGIDDGATSPGELARLWQVTPAVITGIVDRLERRGLVRREADPSDRRRLRLALTERARAASATVERILMDDLAAQLETLTPEQLAELHRSLGVLQQILVTLEAKSPRQEAACADDDMPLWSEDDAEQAVARADDSAARRGLVGAST